jgi:hypothetical protein
MGIAIKMILQLLDLVGGKKRGAQEKENDGSERGNSGAWIPCPISCSGPVSQEHGYAGSPATPG